MTGWQRVTDAHRDGVQRVGWRPRFRPYPVVWRPHGDMGVRPGWAGGPDPILIMDFPTEESAEAAAEELL